mgnify:CR=1 FL=1
MNFKKLFGFIELFIGIAYTYLTTTIRAAALGNPNAPKLFSYGLGALMIVCGIISIVRDRKEQLIYDKRKFRFEGQFRFVVLITLTASLYVVLFRPLGYIIATIIFFEIILQLFNRAAGIVRNTTISVVFSVVMFLVFSQLLNIRLPILPILGY